MLKIRAGDVICCTTGRPETAYQIVNDSDAGLTYLSIGTVLPDPDGHPRAAVGGA